MTERPSWKKKNAALTPAPVIDPGGVLIPSIGSVIIREWYDSEPPEPAPAAPGDRVQLPAIRCSRAEREAWQRKAAARGVTLSQLVRSFLEGLPDV